MHCLIRAGVAVTALAATSVPLQAADDAEVERAFAAAAAGFTTCLLDAAGTHEFDAQRTAPSGDLANACVLQENAFLQSGVRLRMSRGQGAQDAMTETEAAILNGRRMVLADQGQRYALAR